MASCVNCISVTLEKRYGTSLMTVTEQRECSYGQPNQITLVSGPTRRQTGRRVVFFLIHSIHEWPTRRTSIRKFQPPNNIWQKLPFTSLWRRHSLHWIISRRYTIYARHCLDICLQIAIRIQRIQIIYSLIYKKN